MAPLAPTAVPHPGGGGARDPSGFNCLHFPVVLEENRPTILRWHTTLGVGGPCL